MTAVLRVWWTFYTAFPLQRWLAVAGIVSGGLLVGGAFWSGEPVFYVLGGIFFVVLAVFPAVFGGGALLRALSAPRNHQLWPHFRVRVLLAVALLVTSLALLPVALVVLPGLATGRAVPAAALVYPFGFVTAIFLWAFLLSGHWRFMFLGPVLLVAALVTLRGGLGSVEAISGLLLPLVAAAALLAWVAFAAWYLRVRLVGPWSLTAPSGTWWETRMNRPPTREAAVLTLVTGRVQTPFVRQLLATVAVALGSLWFLFLLQGNRDSLPPATSFVWPFGLMVIAGARTATLAHQSGSLWLRIEGRRDEIRRAVERIAWRYWLMIFAGGATIAMLPPVLRGASFRELALGLAICSSAVLYGGYLSLAAVPGVTTVKPYLAGFGLMTIAQIALIARADPAATSVAIVVTVQLLGAALFRTAAVRRWRRIDWLQLRPLAALGRGSRRFAGV
jgi:hypothetical protein